MAGAVVARDHGPRRPSRKRGLGSELGVGEEGSVPGNAAPRGMGGTCGAWCAHAVAHGDCSESGEAFAAEGSVPRAAYAAGLPTPPPPSPPHLGELAHAAAAAGMAVEAARAAVAAAAPSIAAPLEEAAPRADPALAAAAVERLDAFERERMRSDVDPSETARTMPPQRERRRETGGGGAASVGAAWWSWRDVGSGCECASWEGPPSEYGPAPSALPSASTARSVAVTKLRSCGGGEEEAAAAAVWPAVELPSPGGVGVAVP